MSQEFSNDFDDGPELCQLRESCDCDTPAVARAEISGLIASDPSTGYLTIGHWCGHVCTGCLQQLCNKQEQCPDTASIRFAEVIATSWANARVVGNGLVFAPRRKLEQLAPELWWDASNGRPKRPEAFPVAPPRQIKPLPTPPLKGASAPIQDVDLSGLPYINPEPGFPTGTTPYESELRRLHRRP